MARFFHPLIMVLARATESELARYVEYLKAENQILRGKLPKRVVCTPAERQRLVKLGNPLGPAIKELILQRAKDNAWGLGRILGELKKLGIRSVCKSTVRNILKEYGFDPGPKRGEGTWDEFIRIHAKTLWACD